MSPYVALGELISQPTSLDRGISAEASQSNPIPVRHQGRRDEDRAQGPGQRATITTGRRNRPLAILANPFVSSRTTAAMGWSRTREGRGEGEGRAAMFSPAIEAHRHRGRASNGWVKVKGGHFPRRELLRCLRFCRFRAPLSRARPHFSHQVKLG